jgi:hypothetical protein
LCPCREAQTHQWAVEKAKRKAIEKAKADELAAAQRELLEWKANVQDSDTESEADGEHVLQDHEHYFGKGWQPRWVPS